MSFSADHIRPTSDRVKESLFNKLSSYWEGARVLDLFSGTGNLSIESLSWGAASVVAVEQHPKSLTILKQNLEKFGVQQSIKLIKMDVLKFLANFDESAFDIILIDPPFTEKMADKVMSAVSQSRVFSSETIVAIESSKFETMLDSYEPLKRFDSRHFGDKLLSYFKEDSSRESNAHKGPN